MLKLHSHYAEIVFSLCW